MQFCQCYVAAAAVALLGIACSAKNLVVFEPHKQEQDQGSLSQMVTFQDAGKESYHKPLKQDMLKHNVAAHPYTYEDSNLDTYPYMASVTPSYTPPILKFGNSKLDHVAPDHGLHGFQSHPPPLWGKLVRVLTAAIPIGIFLAALPPNVVNINAGAQSVKPLGTGSTTGGVRQRSETDGPEKPVHTFPVLDMIERLGGLSALEHPGCEAYIFCQMSRLGASPEANTVQRTLWSMAHETPDMISELLGARELLKAVRTDACSLYKCPKSLQDPVKPAH